MIYPLATRLRVITDAGDRTPNLVRQVITVTGIGDNVATPLFTVTTSNEGGSADGGAYVCQVSALVAHGGTPATSNAAAKGFQARFSRAMTGGGSGALSAVSEDHDDTAADTDAAARSIGNVTLTVAETSEYVITASITVDLTGTGVDTAEVTAVVEVLWTGFLTRPTIAPA